MSSSWQLFTLRLTVCPTAYLLAFPLPSLGLVTGSWVITPYLSHLRCASFHVLRLCFLMGEKHSLELVHR